MTDSQCNEALQTIDTFKICQIFSKTNVADVYTFWDLSQTNYCESDFIDGPLKIICTNDGREAFLTLELLENGIPRHSGELQTQYEWPSKLKNIKIQNHLFTYSFNGLNFSNILQDNLETLWFERFSNGQNAGVITGMIICIVDVF